MSVNHEDVNRTAEWVASVFPESFSVSRDTIRSMCRGPMKDVLLGFLVPRFRSDQQIKTIRSNLFLFLQDESSSTNSNEVKQREDDARYRTEVKELKQDIVEVRIEKQQTVNNIANILEKATESDAAFEKQVLEALSNYEITETRSSQAQQRVEATNELLKDVDSITPKPSLVSAVNNGIDDEDTPYLGDLKTLYENALELFDVYCGTKSRGNTPASYIESLTHKVDLQTKELAHSGISTDIIEKWVRSEQYLAMRQVKILESKYGNVMNPVEQLSREAEALYVKLMNLHINSRLRNQELKESLRKLKKEIKKKMWHAVKNPNVDVNELNKLLREEEKIGKDSKLQNLAKICAHWERAVESDADLLHFICEESLTNAPGNKDDPDGSQNGFQGFANDETGSGFSSSSSLTQETLEDLTCALLKSFPDSKHQVEMVLRDSKRLMLDMFPKFCEKLQGYQKSNSNFLSVHASSSMPPSADSIVSEKILLLGSAMPYDSPAKSSSNIKSQDFLTEIFRLNGENEKKVNECESLMKDHCINL